MLCFRSSKEKKYAHFIGQASWAGARIIQGQWTPQAQKLFDLLILTFSDKGNPVDLAALKQKSSVSDKDWQEILEYSSQVCLLNQGRKLAISRMRQVLSNLVNYKSFGFTKIVPRCTEDAFAAVVSCSANANEATVLWNEVGEGPYPNLVPIMFTLLFVAERSYLSSRSGVKQSYWQACGWRSYKLLSRRTHPG